MPYCQDEKNSRQRPPPIKAKQDWQERFKNIRIGKRGTEGTDKAASPGMAYAIFDDNICFTSEREIPDSKVSYLFVLQHKVLNIQSILSSVFL